MTDGGEGVDRAATADAAGEGVATAPAAPQRLTPHFMGTGGEYFRIWIVNVALTIATLGIYAAWAKVRTRRYFYAHTVLGGRPFDYLGQPKAILIGHLIVVGVLALSSVFEGLYPVIGGIASFGLWLFFPFLIYKAHRFKAHNSSYRGIRFGFDGTLKEACWVYFLIPMFLLFGGLFYPYWIFKQREYSFGNLNFGTANGSIAPSVKAFYKTYVIGFAILIAAAFAFVPVVSSMGLLGGAVSDSPQLATYGTMAGIGGFVFLVFVSIQQYIYARVSNHCWNNFNLGPVTFEAELSACKLIWIRVTNILAIVATLGLAAPWARVRRTSYLVGCFTVVAPAGLDDFSAAMAAEDSALGDAAADFFDWDVGL
jgi:uncharacterized membrane protein YjgN (DUF898 family)